jgi:probable rRNA maturation factor
MNRGSGLDAVRTIPLRSSMTSPPISPPPGESDSPRRSPRRRGQPSCLRVHVHRAVRQARVPVTRLQTTLRQLGRQERCRGEVQVIVVDDAEMQALNRRFRRRDCTTDVLAFPFADANDTASTIGGDLLGEIYCNYDHARRWRAEMGGTVAAELVRLAVHGCLHLLGYDHHMAHDRKRMIAAENHYLAAAGLTDLRTKASPRSGAPRPVPRRERTHHG